jgi:hypothetical protein
MKSPDGARLTLASIWHDVQELFNVVSLSFCLQGSEYMAAHCCAKLANPLNKFEICSSPTSSLLLC